MESKDILISEYKSKIEALEEIKNEYKEQQRSWETERQEWERTLHERYISRRK